MGCAGTYHVNDAATENLLIARKKGRKGAQIELLDDGECMFTSTSGAANLKVDQIIRLDFEAGVANSSLRQFFLPVNQRRLCFKSLRLFTDQNSRVCIASVSI